MIVKAPGQSFLVLLRETRVQFSVTAFTITLVKLIVTLGLVCPLFGEHTPLGKVPCFVSSEHTPRCHLASQANPDGVRVVTPLLGSRALVTKGDKGSVSGPLHAIYTGA